MITMVYPAKNVKKLKMTKQKVGVGVVTMHISVGNISINDTQ